VEDFEVEVEGTDACVIVKVSGELDIATAPQLVAALETANGREAERLVVDLLATSFIDSTGLTTLFRAHKQHESAGDRAFSIVCGPDNLEVRRVIDLMGFDEVFTIHESLAAAGCGEPGA
jgi:anti-sigma B factor antagonist